jgi:hypothetical protein
LLVLADTDPAGSQQIQPHVRWATVEPLAHSRQSQVILADGAGVDGPETLLGESQPIGRFHYLVDVEGQLLAEEGNDGADLDAVVSRLIRGGLTELVAAVVLVGLTPLS